MPYRHANWFVGLTLAVIIAGFWPSYFTQFGTAPAAFHMHAITSTVWVALLMVQVWSIQNRKNSLHKAVGKASLILFPFMIVGFVAIINHTAWRLANEANPVTAAFAPSFGVGMASAIVMYLVLYYLALRQRRTIALHAGYMLMTPAVLFESPFSRILLDHAPFLIFTGSGFPQIVLDSIVISMGLVVVFCLGLYAFNRKHGAPFLLTAIMIAIQAALMYFAPSIGVLRTGMEAYASLPDMLTLIAAFAIAAAVTWAGWTHGAPRPRAGRAAAPAE
jgi:hypothetical protein